jgi:hypothetical protein
MPPVGRPRITTTQGARPPVNLIGVADPFNYGVGLNPQTGGVAPWHMFIDLQETVPEWFWPNSVWTAEQMRTDSQLAALLTSVMWGISQLRFVIDPNGSRASLVEEISQDLNLPVMGEDHKPQGRLKGRFSHPRFVLQSMLSVIYGHMFFEQNGEVVDGKWRLRRMFPIMPRTIAQMNVEDDGSLVNVVQWASRNSFLSANPPLSSFAEPIPVDRLTGYIFQMEGMNWHGRSMMRDCFKDWVLKDRLMRVEAINHERAGGVPYAVGPQGATMTEIEDLGQMMQQFRIGETAGGAVPYGSSLHIAKGSGSDIDATIKRYDESMARRFMLMLANLAQGGAHVGSYALGETFEDFFLVAQRHIAQWYCDITNEHIIEDIVDWNYGEDEEFVPKITWERTSEDSLGVEQLATLVQRGVIIVDEELENAIRYKYQLPSRSTPRPNIIVGPGVPRQPQELAPGQVVPPRGELPESAQPVPPGAGVTQPLQRTQAAGDPSGAPSSGSPATIRASFRRWLGKKPDVMASSAPALVTVANVPILHAGVEYPLSTGPRTFTPEDLRDAVMAANEDSSVPRPRLKIGHIDPRFNDAQVFDGSPSFGVATNLRLSDNGTTVYADYVGVPKWLADIMPAAYPSRSVEGYSNVPAFAPEGQQLESQMGKRWRFVISACSLLGVQWPGISVLEDLPQFYGEEIPDGVTIDPALLQGGDPMRLFGKTAASVNLDDVRRAFYGEYVPANPEKNWWWVQAVLMDPNELVVEDDESGQLYKLSFSSDKGAVSFGDPQPVRIDYIPETVEAYKAAASYVAATLAVGREVAASWNTRDESIPQPDTGGSMDPKLIRDRLGLPEEATDAQVQETLRELNAAAGIIEPQVPTPPAAEPTPADEPIGEPVAPPAEPVAPAAVAASALPPGTVLVDKAQYDGLVAATNESRDFIAERRKEKRDELVTAAMKDGRIAPASKDHWLNYLEHDPKGEETLASLQPGLIPVELRATAVGGNGEEGDALSADQVSEWSAQLFPEVRAQKEQDAAVAASAGGMRRSRIAADGHYTRR